MGKFPIGTVGGFAYFDINSAFQHFLISTMQSNNLTIKGFEDIIYQNFRASDYANTITINIPNRI
jgi:hypothetical protein